MPGGALKPKPNTIWVHIYLTSCIFGVRMHRLNVKNIYIWIKRIFGIFHIHVVRLPIIASLSKSNELRKYPKRSTSTWTNRFNSYFCYNFLYNIELVIKQNRKGKIYIIWINIWCHLMQWLVWFSVNFWKQRLSNDENFKKCYL